MSADPVLTAHMEDVFNREVRGARRQIVLEERHYALCTGARLAVMAMMDAGVVKEKWMGDLLSWTQQGGVTHLVIKGVRVVPPEYP